MLDFGLYTLFVWSCCDTRVTQWYVTIVEPHFKAVFQEKDEFEPGIPYSGIQMEEMKVLHIFEQFQASEWRGNENYLQWKCDTVPLAYPQLVRHSFSLLPLGTVTNPLSSFPYIGFTAAPFCLPIIELKTSWKINTSASYSRSLAQLLSEQVL